MITEWELWACANHVLQVHGAAAYDHAKSHIDALAIAGDEAGTTTWTCIATRIKTLDSKVLQTGQCH